MQNTRDRLANASRIERFPYAEERLLFEIANALALQMQQLGVSQQELANRLGKHKSEVTKILKGRNVTLRTVARCFAALDLALAPDVCKLLSARPATPTPQFWVEVEQSLVADEPDEEYANAA